MCGAVEDDVARVFEEPVAVALRQRGLLVLDLFAFLAPGRPRLGLLDVRCLSSVLARARGDWSGVFSGPSELRRRRGVQRQFRLVAGGFLAFRHLGNW